jgi:transposase InsO family protein
MDRLTRDAHVEGDLAARVPDCAGETPSPAVLVDDDCCRAARGQGLARDVQVLDGLVHHSDKGVHYLSIRYSERRAENDIVASVGSTGASSDNTMAEATNALYKTELHRNPAVVAANGGAWKGLDDLEVATCAWVSWFNTERLHGALHDRTPAEVEELYHRAHPRAMPQAPTTRRPPSLR